MKKHYLSLLISAFAILSMCFCKRGSKESFTESPKSSFETKIDTTNVPKRLSWYFEKAVELKDDSKYSKLFFYTFPRTFNEFNALYGYSDSKGPMPLYEKYEEHVSFFCDLNALNKEKFASKLIVISLNGHWEADAISMLQHCALSFTKENINLIVKELDHYKSEEIASFWYFLFDGPHPAKDIPINIEAIRNSNPKIYKLAQEAFEQVHLQSEHHGN
jgi:hypothetical protein